MFLSELCLRVEICNGNAGSPKKFVKREETLNRKVTESGLAMQQLRQNATFHKFSATFYDEMFRFRDIMILTFYC